MSQKDFSEILKKFTLIQDTNNYIWPDSPTPKYRLLGLSIGKAKTAVELSRTALLVWLC